MQGASPARIRPAAVAGAFYHAHAAALRREIEETFTSPLGPGAVPRVEAGPRHLVGIIAPHAGYEYSGPGAAWAYAEVARDGRPAGAVILGVNHYHYYTAGSPLALSSADGWATPLGVMPVAQEFGRALRALDADIGVDDPSHAYEHSLEVQVPFLQYLFGELPILPIVVGHTTCDAVLALGMALATLCTAHDLLIIASTDFSHQVPAEVAREQDALALDRIRTMDPLGLMEVVTDRGISMCGYQPTAIALVAAKAMGVEEGTILHYHTSGDVTGDTRQVVGYGAVALEKGKR
ncbi:MAG: hypothetical protein BWY76_00393 [bacterium ADurb.Bin429]|nr:MAG: hypothetical protein BWY76_00393 [bacterium ADurb.Bin429]